MPASLLVSVGWAIAIVAVLLVLLRLRAPLWTCVLPLVLFAWPQWTSAWATYWHGFMHSSMVYEIVERGVPPQNPLMVGEPLRYMYGHHALIAWIMHLIPISPPQAFALTDAICLVLFAIAIERTAALVSADRVFRVMAVVIAFAAFTPFSFDVVRAAIARVTELEVEWRFIPLTKFGGINDNQVGWVLFATAILGVARLAAGHPRRRGAYVLIALAIVLSGYMYPPAWLGIMACAGLAALYFLSRGAPLRRTGVALLVLLAVGAALTAPYIYVLTAGKSPGAAVHLVPPMWLLRQHVENLVLFLAVPALLALGARRALVAAWRRQPHLATVLALGAAITMFMYTMMEIPSRSEYKMLGMSVIVLSVPVTMALYDLYQRHRAIAVGVLVLVLVPVADTFGRAWVHDPVSDPVVSDGRWLRHTDPAQDSLYTWISGSTPVDALFVDSYLTIPVLGRRQLLVGLDVRRESGGLAHVMHDGWLITAHQFLQSTTGVPAGKFTALRSAALALESATPDSAVSERTFAVVERYRMGRPVYVVARTDAVRARLDSVPVLRPAYRGSAATVYRYVPRGG
ncbi:MAG TPA: hypothetical protein VFK13_09120 [Gemmatimonadaceae bacterium]|nr:hypothetical protein [Gemmatimonadaceae bacterium]